MKAPANKSFLYAIGCYSFSELVASRCSNPQRQPCAPQSWLPAALILCISVNHTTQRYALPTRMNTSLGVLRMAICADYASLCFNHIGFGVTTTTNQ
jgi:hypothetical protein